MVWTAATLAAGYFRDGSARAIRCACVIREVVATLGIIVRVGLHTSECVLAGETLGGVAVHIGARVAANAEPGQVLVSSPVKDRVAGSGRRFSDRGFHTLSGIPDEGRLYAVEA